METEDRPGLNTKVYKYRWVVLAIFCLFISISFAQLLQFTIIANILKTFYNVGDFEMDCTGLVFFVTFILGCLPISILVEKYNLKASCVVATGLTLSGNLIKLACAEHDRYWVALVAQALCSLGLVCMANVTTKFASVWFGSEEVSTACAITVFGSQLGAALGAVIPPYAVSNKSPDDVKGTLYDFFTYQAIITAVIFIITVFFFRSRPKLPPSLSQVQLLETEKTNESFFTDFKVLAKNKDYILVVCSLGMSNAVFNSFGIILNALYTKYFPGGESDAGLIVMSAILSGGCIGSVIFGLILDKTHTFRLVSFFIIAGSALALVGTGSAIVLKSRVGAFIGAPIFGFFLNSTLVVGYEFALEVSYPVPESFGLSVLNASNYTFSIVITLIMEGIAQGTDYPYAVGFAVAVLAVAAINVLFISNNLRRRDANMKNANGSGVNDDRASTAEISYM